MAHVYPQGMRATRDLLRRRTHLMRKRSELLAHKLARATYYILKRKEVFSVEKFLER